MQSVRMKNRKKIRLETVILQVVLILLSLLYIVPFFWLVLGSLKTNTELFAVPMVLFPAVPQWSNYANAVQSFPFLLYLKNTMIIIGFGIIGSLISNSLVAYGFSCIEWKGRNALFMVSLTGIMLPFQVTMIPLFLIFQKMKIIGTLLPMIITTFFGNAFFIFLLRQFFIGIPKPLIESAKIDGASEFTVYFNIVLPLAKPALTTVVIFVFLNSWNDFVGPLIFLTDGELYTLSIGIQQIMSQNDPRWTTLLPAGVIMTVPVLVIFFVLQKYFIQGIAASGIKG